MTEDGSKQVPDPTVLTTEAVDRAMESAQNLLRAELRVINQRLDGMDKATDLIDRQVTRVVPTEVDRTASHLRDTINHQRQLMDEKFASVYKQFASNKVALDAALAAQKEAVAEQNKANAAAINKSEEATSKQLDQLGELARTTNDALAKQLGDLKESITRLQSIKQGGKETMGGIYAALAGVATLMVLFGILAANGMFN